MNNPEKSTDSRSGWNILLIVCGLWALWAIYELSKHKRQVPVDQVESHAPIQQGQTEHRPSKKEVVELEGKQRGDGMSVVY